MASTRGKKINFDMDPTEGGYDHEGEIERPAKPAAKRRNTKKFKSGEGHRDSIPGSLPAKRTGKGALIQNQLITRRSGRGGKLRGLMNVPVDIFTEICSYLDPRDLRRLALSSKRLWDILMTREVRHIWRTALAAVPDLPECPVDLNEPQYHARTPIMGSKSRRHACYIEALKKGGKEYESLPQEEVVGYLSLLKEASDYRVQTGKAMMEWKCNELACRAEDIAAEKQARFESIKLKLVEMGWVEQDFPTDNKEFRDLVFKDQKLTPKIWQNLKPKLEPLLEASRNERLEIEKREGRMRREKAIRESYHQVAREIMGPPFQNRRVDSILTRIEEVFALPSIKPLLENDTETVTAAQWIEVAPDVRHIAVKWWRDTLKKLVDCLEHSETGQPNGVSDGDEGAANLERETDEATFGSIETLRTKLSYTRSVFC
ncbi:hypothetical protein FRC00_006332, partial [Tulasnella sp. 408]